jgi:hypothetical protein
VAEPIVSTTKPALVQSSIAGFDAESRFNTRVRTKAEAEEVGGGFVVRTQVDTWHDSVIWGAWVNWVALF